MTTTPSISPRRAAFTACVAAALAVGCSTVHAASPSAPPYEPGGYDPASLPHEAGFGDAVTSLGEQVQLLRVTPASQQSDPGIRRAVSTLADAIDDAPGATGVDVASAARLMREDFPENVGGEPWRVSTATDQARGALQVAGGALLLLSRGPYAGTPGLDDRVSAFRQAADAIEPGQPLEAERKPVVDALGLGWSALSAIGQPSGAAAPQAPGPRPPPAVPPASGATEAQGAGAAASRPFSAALSSYSTWVNRFVSLAPGDSPGALRHAFDALADALAALPHREGAARPETPAEIAAEIHVLAADFQRAPAMSAEQARIARRVFERADAAFAHAARRERGGNAAFEGGVYALHARYEAIDPSRPLRAQLPRVLGSLEAAEQVLRQVALTAPR